VGAKKICFDGWALDPDSGDLERAGTRIRLQEQPLQLLMELIGARGGVVTREQLIAQLWPKGVVDFDTGLNTAIRKLRAALGDTADTPRYIETLPRRGYRFIAALDADPEAPQFAVPAPQPLSIPVQAEFGSAVTAETDELGSPPPGLPPRAVLFRRAVLSSVAVVGLVAFLVVWYRSRTIEIVQPQPTATTKALPIPEKSVAVLPFVDMSEKHDQEYFSDGLSEELIDMLTKVPDLRVPARTSSFYFKGKQTKVSDIARELGVAHVLEGSVRKSGNRLRITAQLVRVDSGYHLWSQTYDRNVGDIFQIQDDIATAVVSSLGPKLGMSTPPAVQGGGVVIEAYDAWLLARSLFSRPQSGSFQRGIAALEKAIRLDPNFAPAYSALAFARCNAAAASGRTDVIAESKPLLEKALTLSPDLADAFAARSQCRLYSLDLPGSLIDAQRAVAGAPGDARFQIGLAYALAGNGNFGEAIAAAKVGTELDPLNIYGWIALGEFLTMTHEWPDARRALERALQISPEEPESTFALGTLDLLEGHAEKALATFENLTGERHRKAGAALAYHALGRDRESREVLAELIAKHKDTAAYQISEVYAWRGDRDEAMQALDRAYQHKDSQLATLKFDPLFQDVQTDPRYHELLGKLGLPQ
jgi:TolB-like protein/DNA-binding winged helix-turn-helix (wHTH) protein